MIKQEKEENKQVRIVLKSFDSYSVDKAIKSIVKIVRATGSKAIGPVPLPQKCHRISIPRSPHIFKTAQDQFETKIYKRLLDIYCTSNSTIDSLIKLEVSASVDVKIKLINNE
jgi:small subunit ribosomal protein S10